MTSLLPSFYYIAILLVWVLINFSFNSYSSFTTKCTAFCLICTKSVLPTNCQSALCIEKTQHIVSLLKQIPLPGTYKIKSAAWYTKKARSGVGFKPNLSFQPLLLLCIIKSVKFESLNYFSMGNPSLMVFFLFQLGIFFLTTLSKFKSQFNATLPEKNSLTDQLIPLLSISYSFSKMYLSLVDVFMVLEYPW